MRAKVLVLSSVCSLALLSACGSDQADANEGGDGAESMAITVGVLPITEVAPIYLGVEQGFFEEEGLDVTITSVNSGAATVSGVVSNDFEFAFTGVLPFFQAREANVPLAAVANGVYQTSPETHGEGRSTAEILVNSDSPIVDPADLEGATVAVNALGGVQELAARNSLEANGVDPSSIKFVELPVPTQPDALAQGQVDAIFAAEPFETIALNEGARIVLSPYNDTEFPLDLAIYITSQQFLSEQADVVERFGRAINRSMAYAQSNPDEARATIGEYTDLPPAVLADVVLSYWDPAVSRDSLEEQANLALTSGLLKNAPDIDAMLSTMVAE